VKGFKMKKTLIAIALSTVAASSYAQTTVYGKMRIYTESDKVGTASPITKQTSNGSWLGFRGTEDLGGGMKANFVIETTVAADSPSASSFGDRQSTVGLSGNNASIDLGRSKHAIARLFDSYDAFGNPALYSSITTVHAAHGARLSNGAFATLKFDNISASFNHGSSEVIGTPSIMAGSLNADIGPVSVSFARYDNQLTSSSNVYAAKYNIKQTGTTIAAVYSDDEVSGVKTQGKTIGLTQAISGPWVALASYGQKQEFKATNIGVNYVMSMRTSINVRYKNEDSTTSSSDRRQYAVGIDHNF